MSVIEICRNYFTLKSNNRIIFSYKSDSKIVRLLSYPLSPLSIGSRITISFPVATAFIVNMWDFYAQNSEFFFRSRHFLMY